MKAKQLDVVEAAAAVGKRRAWGRKRTGTGNYLSHMGNLKKK